MTYCGTLSAAQFDGVIFDLDGVITDTASLHAASWKRMFDRFLASRPDKQPPFEMREYYEYVDGKPRFDGAAAFLASRGIELPHGSSEDPPEAETIGGLGNLKNSIFNELLEEKGVKVYSEALPLIRRLQAAGLKVALVTSSRNGRKVLQSAGLSEWFDVILDGRDARLAHLAGKPAPDYFVEAARRMGVAPERAAVFEDAESGVQAGRRGGFGCVVGVNRSRRGRALAEHGADVVVEKLGQIRVASRSEAEAAGRLPSALACFEELEHAMAERRPVVFLDYDGTLTPIVKRPEDAWIPDAMRSTVRQLARHCIVAIVSGRDLQDVRLRVGLPELYFAGSHGFDMAGPGGFAVVRGGEFLPDLDRAGHLLAEKLKDIAGAQVERKKFSIAVHYRNVADDKIEAVAAAAAAVADESPRLRRTSGKKVFELQPALDWNKGRAVAWLLADALKVDRRKVLPIYIGDDTTDEDAFRELRADGVGILVDEGGREESAAHYRLADTDEVRLFLRRLTAAAERVSAREQWRLVHEGYEPEKEGLREALTTLGNGYFCSRGAWAQVEADGIHYPGTYLAGGYNRLQTEIDGRIIENEDLVNLPNWLPLDFRFEDGPWFHPEKADFLFHRQELDLHGGVLHRRYRFRDAAGRITGVHERRLVHMSEPHLAAIELTVRPENWSGRIEFRSGIDGRVGNAGVKRYSGLDSRHLRMAQASRSGEDSILLKVETNQSALQIAMAARTRIFRGGRPVVDAGRRTMEQPGLVQQLCGASIEAGHSLRAEKVVGLFTSRDAAISECGLAASAAVAEAGDFDELLAGHGQAWHHMWRRFELELEFSRESDAATGSGPIGMIVNLYIFHLLQVTSINTMRLGLDTGVPSRGWHGEAYRGHVFWDELFVFPTLNLRLPEITKRLLMYRYRRLPAARANARRDGYRGAMFPWQSGSTGREESQSLHLNPLSGRWLPDNSRLQRHVNIAIAYNLYQYYQVTHDREFLAFYGAETALEIARFLASLSQYNAELDRYEIKKVMGPDEYHDAYPDADEPGLDNNAYTNIMTVWVLRAARELLDELSDDVRAELYDRLDLELEEFRLWEEISRKMRVVFHDQGRIISQFEGYGDLLEFDWEGYARKYEDIQRLDRILEAEGDTPNRYKVSKQADVLMLFYLLSAEELAEIFEGLGYPFEYETIPRNIDYYLKRTSHGSTLSGVVHSWVLARSDRPRAWQLFQRALQSDVSDIQGGTTPEGIHLGAMAGTVDQLQRGFTGIVTRGHVLWFNPRLPDEVSCLRMSLRYRFHFLDVEVTQQHLRVTSLKTTKHPIDIGFREKVYELSAESTRLFKIE